MNTPRPVELQLRALAIFEGSLEQPEDDRDHWIAARCNGDAALAAEVERLCVADRSTGSFLESPAITPRDHRGERFGPFLLEDELGAGGMGRVYRARRVDDGFEQEVAIKLFDHGFRDATALARFDAERRILARLEHPGIARLIDGGTAGDDTPWVAMELVRGEPITLYCERHRLGVAERVALMIRVCNALEAAHERGVVHRDIKPGNVLVDEHGKPRVIDFGIAKVLDASFLEAELPATATQAVPLTPEYASPEQVRGEIVGTASDVYGLGILLYELLTGTRPYRLTSPSPLELARTVCLTIPPDPSDRVARARLSAMQGLPAVRELRRRLRGDLDRIVMTALRKTPNERYASAAGLGRDLERHLTGQPVSARGASRWYRLRCLVQRHRFASAATAVAMLILAAGLIAVSIQARRVQHEAERAEAARDFLASLILRADPFETAPEPTLAGALRASLQDIGQRFAGQPQLEADMRYAIGYALQNLGDAATARQEIQRALAYRNRHGTALEQAEALDGLGLVDWWDSDLGAAEARLKEALQRIEGDDSPEAQKLRVESLTNLGAMLIDAGDFPRSVEYSRRAEQAAESAGDIDIETRAMIQGNLGNALTEIGGREEEALAAFARTEALQREATGEMHPNFAILLNNRALALHGMGRLDEAIKAMRRSVDIRRATLGPKHPQTATALFNLAGLLVAANRPDDAEPFAREALQVAEGGYEAGHPRIGKAHEMLGRVLAAQGHVQQARDQLEKSLSIYRNATDVDPAWATRAQSILDGLPAR
ncbi:MAG: serine/threonine protein kinase [Xanthomonadales bacterium]|nr:serine/threonine protein kinase [Xanthomonadales bacterium]